MYVNKVGPFFNPHETYHYYQLPVCRPNKVVYTCTAFCSLIKYQQSCFILSVVLFVNTRVNMRYVALCNQIEPKSLTLGEVLDGDRMALSLYELHFKGLQIYLKVVA